MAGARGKHVLLIEAAAVVADPQVKVVRLQVQIDADAARPGVLQRIGHRLLRDAQQMLLHLFRQLRPRAR